MEENTENTGSNESRDPDGQVQDDAIIGVAFKRSLQTLGLLAALGMLFFLLGRRQPPEAPEVSIERQAPRQVVEEETAPEVRFVEVSAASGVDFVHLNGAEGEKLLPETMGSGAAFFDFDNDQDQDLLLVNSTTWPHTGHAGSGPTSRMFRNDGTGSFTDVTSETGLGLRLYGTGVAVGDYDGDGWTDVFVAAVGGNRLLQNVGGRFTDVTAAAGVVGDAGAWSTSAAFFDADNDADLDLFVCNYVRWSRDIDLELDYRLTGVGRAYGPPVNYEGTFSYLYRNNGDGTFSDISAASGIEVRNEATGVPVGKALAVLPIDFEGDGRLDLLVANDTVRNFVFHNLGDGIFEEVGEFWGVAYGRSGEATGAMGVDAAYYRNDSDLGFAIANFANEMTSLYVSQGDPTLFADEAIGEGVGAPSRSVLSFGILFMDVDLDGRLDLLETNGHLESEINSVDPSQSYAQPGQLFWNAGPVGRQGFVALPAEAIGDLARPIVGRGSAYADIDGDGDLDLVLTQAAGPALLMRND
ncbi:MAG: VCBS repeat-containing protein, partial [Acidobacteriota bacterium]|nr:VCBS repeat-containing protein [Acidobacteriota bacterium]